jgi:hypothetical protein
MSSSTYFDKDEQAGRTFHPSVGLIESTVTGVGSRSFTTSQLVFGFQHDTVVRHFLLHCPFLAKLAPSSHTLTLPDTKPKKSLVPYTRTHTRITVYHYNTQKARIVARPRPSRKTIYRWLIETYLGLVSPRHAHPHSP